MRPQIVHLTKILLLLIGTISLSGAAAKADTLTYGGTTAGGPFFARPDSNEDRVPVAPSGFTSRYNVLQFSVSAAGSYVFASAATAPLNWDNFTLLYQNVFNAAAPLSGVLIGNDDNPTVGLSGFSYSLSAGVNYFFVTTGFTANDAGAFNNTVTGPGVITAAAPIPEPATLTLLGLGVSSLVAIRKRRRS